jgi:CheY-like chemotaxis protein
LVLRFFGSSVLGISTAVPLITPRLLITDDDRDFRETVAGALADRGFETLQAGDGEEALDVVSRQEVHLLLLDMHMPRLSGLEMIERLRSRELIVPVPWILISAGLDERIVAQARAAAVFSVLPKPVRLPELTGAVAKALEAAYGWRAA